MRPKSLLVMSALLALILFECPAQQHQPWQMLTYDASSPALDWNPLRGFVPEGVDQADSKFPHSMVWINLPLRPIMTGPSSFDWKTVDQALERVSAVGYQGILHFYVDYPGYSTGIPQFLLDEGLQTFSYSDLQNNGKSICPDYRDQRIVQAFNTFLIALASRYDGDPRIAFLVPGLYGFRGDWQIEKHSEWEMFPFDRDLLVSTMAHSFKKTVLQLRHPGDSSNQTLVRNFGLYDSSFVGLTLGGHPWNFWTQVQQANMASLWETRPMGGGLSALWFGKTGVFTDKPTAAGKQVLACIRTTHLSWQVAPTFFDSKGLPSNVKKDDLMKAARLMGYQLSVPSVSIVPDAKDGLNVSVKIENHGIAPFYGKWPVEIGLVNAKGELTSRVTESWPLDTILPGDTRLFGVRIPKASGSSGTLLVMRIVPPLSKSSPVRFANISQDATLEGWLTLADIRKKVQPDPSEAPSPR
jgi:hypothetical protein